MTDDTSIVRRPEIERACATSRSAYRRRPWTLSRRFLGITPHVADDTSGERAHTRHRWWADKDAVLQRVRTRVARELAMRAPFEPGSEGQPYAPVVDLSCVLDARYGWMTSGIATNDTDPAKRLARGTALVFVRGEQEQGPGGPGENLLWFEVQAPNSGYVQGMFVVPYDLRFSLGSLLGGYLLARPEEPLFSRPDRLNDLASDILSILVSAPARVWTWPSEGE